MYLDKLVSISFHAVQVFVEVVHHLGVPEKGPAIVIQDTITTMSSRSLV